jgi:hypothetical protein
MYKMSRVFTCAFCTLLAQTLLSTGESIAREVVVSKLAQDAPALTKPVDRTTQNAAANAGSLRCMRTGLALTTSPQMPKSVSAHTTLVYEIHLTNRDTAGCSPRTVMFQPNKVLPHFTLNADPTNRDIKPGETVRFTVSVTGASEADAGVYSLPFRVRDVASGEAVAAKITYILKHPDACAVSPSRELLIRAPSVVDDPVRTAVSASADPRSGAWHFGRLMEHIAPTPADAPAMVERFFQTWLSDQVINDFVVPARPGMRALVLDAWPRTAHGALDLRRAPLRLLAIVNRIDLRTTVGKGIAGEGRFVFGILDRVGNPVEFTLILEYRLPALSHADVLVWAREWHRLGGLPFPSEAYNAALQALTDRFTVRGITPPVLNAIRTNEEALSTTWELRQFRVRANGIVEPAPVEMTPSNKYVSGSFLIADFVNTHRAEIVRESHSIPQQFKDVPLLGGSSLNNLVAWSAPGILDPEARHHFSLNTCNGCHGSAETHTEFLHIAPRSVGEASSISAFLRGLAMHDPISGDLRILNELGRRKSELERLVCEHR